VEQEKDDCPLVDCIYNRDGKCLDKECLKDPYKQTGCIFYD